MTQTARIFIAGLLGGLVMMVWVSVAHLSPLGQIGCKNLPGADAIRAGLGSAVGAKPGLYFFPAMDMAAKDSAKAMADYTAAAKTGPSGFVLYRPAGEDVSMTGAALQEFGKLVVVATISAFLLAEASARLGYGARVGFVVAIGTVATLTTNASHHAWYGFPGDYIAAQIGMDIMGFILGGLVIAWLVKPRAAPPVT